MKRPDPVERALARLSALKTETEMSASVSAELKTFLNSRSNLVVAKTARVIAQMRAEQLTPELADSFRRLMANPQKLDKGCAAMTEIVASLYELDYLEPDIYLFGIHHLQMEGSFGPPVDAAAKLRGLSAQGLARTQHPDALDEIVSLLVDDWPEARIGAVRALASNGGEAGTLLLKLRVLTGETEPDVLAECFSGLLAGAPRKSLQLIAKYTDAEDPDIAQVALLALGSSRLPEAFDLLRARWERMASHPLRRASLLAISMIRSEPAIEFLLSLLEETRAQAARDVITALAIFRGNCDVRTKVEAAVSRRGDRTLSEAFLQEF